MAKLDMRKSDGEKAGSVELDPAVFEATVRPDLFHAEVRRQLAVRRAGTHASKNRAAVSGGGAKPYRQKGTGRARQGTTRAPQFAGGGVVFGPVPRSYAHKLPKKMRRAALQSALTEQLRAGAITIVEDLLLDEYKTRAMVDVLTSLGLAGQKVLIVIGDENPTVEGSARNIKGVGLVRAAGANVYDVLRHDKIVITKPAIEALQARLSSSKGVSAPAGATEEATS
jgi:large subunit ribosomal protein L4